MPIAARLSAALVVLVAGGCYNPNGPAAPVHVLGVKVTPQVVQLPEVGDTARVYASIAPANATDTVIVWESTDSSVVTVSTSGLLTAKAAGAGIFVTAHSRDGDHQASVNVSVAP